MNEKTKASQSAASRTAARFVLAAACLALAGCWNSVENRIENNSASASVGAEMQQGQNWRATLDRELKRMGHRNWILVADSAYPAQVSPGIATVVTGAGQLDVVSTVLAAINEAPHVRANVYLDAEMDLVPEEDAAGIGEYRDALHALLEEHDPTSASHDKLIDALDEAGQTFSVLVLKTDMTLPYTSVFFELDCGYWSAEAEKSLRDSME